MKNQTPIIHCIFTENENHLSELLEQSFELYIQHMLTNGMPHTEIHPKNDIR